MPDTPQRPDLRDELARLAATQWTDYNAHDPGVTILEQLDYALSDLAYRASFPIADLLANRGADPNQDLPGPAEILSTKAVTEADVHALLADVEGVAGGWLAPRVTPELVFFHHADSGQLRLFDEPGSDPEHVELAGLSRVLVRKVEDDRTTAEGVLAAVGAQIHAQRNTCTDVSLGVYTPRPIWVRADLEVGPVDEPDSLLADIFTAIEQLLAPTTRLASLNDRLEAGARVDEIYDGPKLAHGFLASDQVQPRPGNVRSSDIIHVLLDLPEVRAVRTLTLSLSETGRAERWEISIGDGEAATLALGSPIRLLRAGLELGIDRSEAERRYHERRLADSKPGTAAVPARPRGRDRAVQRYESVQDQFPRVYGIGRFGLPLDAPAARRAQARQLEAYLLLCDQLLANTFAQLAHVGPLFRWSDDPAVSYVAGAVEGEGLRLDDLRLQRPKLDDSERRMPGSPPVTHAEWLTRQVEVDDSFERRNRFLNHLLARFCEQPVDHALLQAQHREDPLELIRDKQAFLAKYVEISSGRGTGHDVLTAASASALAERVRLRLGHDVEPRQFFVLEHLLLRPIPEDARQRAEEGAEQVPLLDSVTQRDPYSHQLSYVFLGPDPELHTLTQAQAEYVELVEQTLLEETPAHLIAYVLWLDGTPWSTFAAAHGDWRDKYAAYRAHKLGAAQTDAPPELHLPVRDARDRLIDMLGFGRSYPLRDLPVPGLLIVPPGDSAKIPIGFSQAGVSYRLHDARTGAPIKGSTPVEGGGRRAPQLLSPPIVEDVRYRIQATKIETDAQAEPRSTWLHQLVIVEVGLDVTLTASIAAELLDPPQTGSAADSAPRIIFFGEQTHVVMPKTQEGVSYDLIQRLTPPPGNATKEQLSAWREQLKQAPALSDVVIGTAGQIELVTRANEAALDEDIDLAIRAQKTVGSDDAPELKIEQLTIILPLKVRAKRLLGHITAQLVPSAIIDHGGTATLRLGGAQASADYRVHIQRTYDDAFLFERTNNGQEALFRRLPGGAEQWLSAGPSNLVLDVAVGNGHTVHVMRPPVQDTWQPQSRFEARPWVAGAAASLELPIEQLEHDTTVLIEARKQHINGPLTDAEAQARPRISSSVQLEQAALVLVRPNTQSGLYLEAYYDGARVRFTANSGQPGVLYTFGEELGAAFVDRAYIHKRDDYDPALNKGIGQLRIRGSEDDVADLSVAVTQIDDSEGPATQAPLAPVLDTDPALAVGLLRSLNGQTVGVTRSEKVITRVTSSHVAVTVVVDRSDVGVDLLVGIGSVTAGRLADAGLATIGALAEATLDGVVIEKVTPAQLQHWQAAAKLLVAYHELSPQQADMLATLGVATPQDAEAKLAEPEGLTPEQIAALEIVANSSP